jgi:glycosyltransferase involved in cell wall biosynthesis
VRRPVRVHVVDPSAFTPPYDRALCAALARQGAEVTLVTSRFPYGEVPPSHGYDVVERFYRGARGTAGGRLRRGIKALQHVPDMRRYRREAGRNADVVHFQWLAVQHVDARMLPKFGPPLVLTAHDVLPREPRPGQLDAQRRLYECVDAVIVHSEHGRTRLVEELEVDPDIVHLIPHGVFEHLVELEPELPHELAGADPDVPVVLCLGLLRPYKGIDVLLDAWRGVEGAELWIVGHPRMDTGPLHAAAGRTVRFVERFITDAEVAGCLRRADVVALPYREIEQSGVLFAALAFAKPLILTAVGGFPEVALAGAATLVPSDDPAELHVAIRRLLDHPDARRRLADGAARAARERYGWDPIAHAHLAVYEQLRS